jgi:hypothetical protein
LIISSVSRNRFQNAIRRIPCLPGIPLSSSYSLVFLIFWLLYSEFFPVCT